MEKRIGAVATPPQARRVSHGRSRLLGAGALGLASMVALTGPTASIASASTAQPSAHRTAAHVVAHKKRKKKRRRSSLPPVSPSNPYAAVEKQLTALETDPGAVSLVETGSTLLYPAVSPTSASAGCAPRSPTASATPSF